MKKILTFAIVVLMGMGAMAQKSTLKTIRSVSEKSYFSFHWGFNNWGADHLSGLTGLSDARYDLRTSFSSYQLSTGYNFIKTSHLEAGIGIGYESDVYKYNTPGVIYSDAVHDFIDVTPSSNDMSTKFCTRYVTLPVGIAYQTKDSGVKIRLSAIPGLGFTSKHTGLKFDDGSNVKRYSMKDALNPYKMDVRVDLMFGGVGVFLQVATMPLMNENFGQDLYPIKFGFVL